MSLRKVFAQTMVNVAKEDPKLIVIVGDISHGIFEPFREKFPQRYFNIGICEPAMVNVAAGLSAQKLHPVVHTIAPFLVERAYEQIKLDFAYQNLGVNLVSVGGAFDYSKLGCSHHCYTDYSLLAKFDSANIFFPGSEIEFQELFEKNYQNGMINYFRLTENPHSVIFQPDEVKIGKGIKVSDGSDLTIITTGSSLEPARLVVEKLNNSGYRVDLLYIHTLKPFDSDFIFESVKKTKKVIVFEEISSQDGVYNLVTKTIGGEFTYKSKQIAVQDFVRTYGTYQALLKDSGVSFENLYESALKLLH